MVSSDIEIHCIHILNTFKHFIYEKGKIFKSVKANLLVVPMTIFYIVYTNTNQCAQAIVSGSFFLQDFIVLPGHCVQRHDSKIFLRRGHNITRE